MPDKLIASEALYGFCAWLTTRKEKTIMSDESNSAPIASLVSQFCDENKLTKPREGWDKNLIHPKGGRTKESITKSIEATIEEMVTIATLKEAIASYLLLDDTYEEDTTAGFCLILGRLEISIIRRKQMLDEDRKALLELKDE